MGMRIHSRYIVAPWTDEIYIYTYTTVFRPLFGLTHGKPHPRSS